MKSAMKSVPDFDTAISKLDSLIASGWAKYKLAERAFSKARDEGTLNENIGKLLKDHRGTHNVWFEEVRHGIELLTDRNYYWVLFINAPKNDGKWISGLGADLSTFLICFENELRVLSEILIMLEERRGTVIKQEIVQQEYDASQRYWLRYDEMAGKLYLNGTILIASTRLDYPADKLLQQVFASPNNLIELEGITSAQVTSALRDMNIKGNLKKVFFPRTSGKKVLFRPSITNTEFVKEKLQDISLSDFMRTDEI
jgi:hypothetical protein